LENFGDLTLVACEVADGGNKMVEAINTANAVAKIGDLLIRIFSSPE
jgi:hypothetical protein